MENIFGRQSFFSKFVDNVVDCIIDIQLGEALLSAPVMPSMGLVQGIVALSANHFLDFLLSYIVGFGFLILERMCISPFQSDVLDWAGNIFSSIYVNLSVQYCKFY